MKIQHSTCLILLSLTLVLKLGAQSVSTTFIGGNLGTKVNEYDNACSGIVALQLPTDDVYVVTGVDVAYSFLSVNGRPVSEQRSGLEFLNNGNQEAEVPGPVVEFQNPVPYSRMGIDIANGTYAGGTNLQFALRLKSEDLTFLGNSNCDISRHYVVNGSFTVTVHYTAGPKVGINTTSPEALLDVNGKIMIADDDYIAKEGMVKYDVISKEFSGYNGNIWKSLTKGESIQDLDADTKILPETAPGTDDDEIAIFLGGTQKWRITSNRIEHLISGGNLMIGEGSGGNVPGADNTVLGNSALAMNSGSTSNVAIGKEAMNSNTTGYENTAIGKQSLNANITGYHNVAAGHLALSSNTTGRGNVAVGKSTASAVTVGMFNTAVGFESLQGTGSRNTVLGTSAGLLLGSGNRVTAVGYSAKADVDGVSLGSSAESDARCVVAGASSNASRESVAIGYDVNAFGESVVIGNESEIVSSFIPARAVGIGFNSVAGGRSVTMGHGTSTGSESVAIGRGAAAMIEAVAIGHSSFSDNDGIAIGHDASAGNDGIAIGLSVSAPDDEVVIGNASVTSIGGPQVWTVTSDKRYKKAIKRDIPGLNFIRLLEPVSYHMDTRRLAEDYDADLDFSEAGSIRHNGFLAQDVEKAALSIGYDFYGVDSPNEEGGKYGLRYAAFVVPLVKAVQEQQEVIDSQQRKISELEKLLESMGDYKAALLSLEARLEALELDTSVAGE